MYGCKKKCAQGSADITTNMDMIGLGNAFLMDLTIRKSSTRTSINIVIAFQAKNIKFIPMAQFASVL